MTRTISDLAERERIRTDLATNFLVEAGAGSGKTTSLVERLLEHVRTGTPVERIAAVTFTRKAAHELRERFQLRLERAVRDATAGSEERARFDRALRELDRAFLGTIHSFCARLLRERPVESGVAPGFTELDEVQDLDLRRRVWREFITSARADADPDMLALLDVESSLCKQGGGRKAIVCPFHERCGYQRQKLVEANIWFAAHEMMTHAMPKARVTAL